MIYLSYYLSKYVGKYRVKSIIDPITNDFPKDFEGNYESYDTYIKCNNNIQIKYYGKGLLSCYVPSVGRGHNILKGVATELGLDLNSYGKQFNYEKLYDDLIDAKVISYITETDEELLWRFKDKYLELMLKFITPNTSGASISPYSPKNLPIREYDIPDKDIEEYRQILDSLGKKNMWILAKSTTRFIEEVVPEKHRKYRNKDMEALMRKEQLKGKEFIHFSGFWNEYIEYLKGELEAMDVKL